MYRLPHELLIDLRLRILRNKEVRKLGKSLKCLELTASTHSAAQKVNVDSFLENRRKSAVKHSREKPISLNFVNLSTIFCPKL